jgi:sec-independent protein translocase protein TatB
MFEVGFTEIVLIFGIALLVLGPARLPKLAADLGRWAGRARAMARQLRSQLEQEVQFDPLATNSTSKPAAPSYAPTHASQPTPSADDAARPAPTQAADVMSAAPALQPPTAAALNADITTTVPDERQPG